MQNRKKKRSAFLAKGAYFRKIKRTSYCQSITFFNCLIINFTNCCNSFRSVRLNRFCNLIFFFVYSVYFSRFFSPPPFCYLNASPDRNFFPRPLTILLTLLVGPFLPDFCYNIALVFGQYF